MATSATEAAIETFMQGVRERNLGQPEFHQAVHEVVETLMPHVLERRRYRDAKILERMTEPDRIIIFRVTWETDEGEVRVNRAWRVQFNNSIGPYKGGLRFHPTVTLSVLKFLGFEQVFKNSLTGLPMGGAKGGSNFDPKGRSDREVMRFCKSMMTELQRHIGEDTDVPAGDIGVGAREIGYLFGQYNRLNNRWSGVLTGKGIEYGGSLIRKEATGYGVLYFVQDMLKTRGESVEGKRVAISGAGNVAIYAAKKTLMLGGTVVTLSDSSGAVYDPSGIDEDKLEFIRALKEERRGRIKEYAERYKGVEYREGANPWGVECDIALPCATQNELELEDANKLVAGGCSCVAEGANMPSTLEAVHRFREARVLFGPAKAANAGGVAVSGLEQSQNALRLSWSSEKVDQRLDTIMEDIHRKCERYGRVDDGYIDYVKGANLAGFVKVADAMLAFGIN